MINFNSNSPIRVDFLSSLKDIEASKSTSTLLLINFLIHKSYLLA